MPFDLLSIATLGLAVVVGILGMSGFLEWLFKGHVAWLERQKRRFSPDVGNVKFEMGVIYAVAILVLFALLYVFRTYPWVALVLWGVLLLGPGMYINWKWAKRLKKIEEQMPQAITSLSTAVASGLTLVQGIERLGERAEEPVRTEFALMANQWRAGSDVMTVIEEAKRRLKLPNFSIFASTITVNQTMGGNVVETLDRLAHSLEEIAQMQHEVYTATAEGRQNIKFLGLAPIPMLGLMCFINYSGTVMLFTTTLGQILTTVSLAFFFSGWYWAWRIVNADV